jgi:hypothetical protein
MSQLTPTRCLLRTCLLHHQRRRRKCVKSRIERLLEGYSTQPSPRPDIAYAVGQVSQFLENPGPAHWNGVKRILAYLKGTVDHGIIFEGTNESLQAYSDADFARCTDTRRSITGCLLRTNGPVGWCSRRQEGVTTSTTQAEYTAAFEVSKEVAWMRTFLNDVGVQVMTPTPLLCDNKSAISLSLNPESHRRTKHFDVTKSSCTIFESNKQLEPSPPHTLPPTTNWRICLQNLFQSSPEVHVAAGSYWCEESGAGLILMYRLRGSVE